VKEMGFSGINNFPTHTIIDGQFGQSIEETNMGVQKEIDCVELATSKMDMFSIVYVATPEEAAAMTKAGADVVIAHVGCTVGGSIGVSDASLGLDQAAAATQAICEAVHSVNKETHVLSHGGPILTPSDAAYINERTDTVGFVGASSIERIAVEGSIPDLTREFKSIPVKRIK